MSSISSTNPSNSAAVNSNHQILNSQREQTSSSIEDRLRTIEESFFSKESNVFDPNNHADISEHNLSSLATMKLQDEAFFERSSDIEDVFKDIFFEFDTGNETVSQETLEKNHAIEQEQKTHKAEEEGTKTVETGTKTVETGTKTVETGAKQSIEGKTLEAIAKADHAFLNQVISNKMQQLEHGRQLFIRNGEFSFGSSLKNADADTLNLALNEHTLVIPGERYLFADPTSGLTRGETITIRDERGNERSYIIEHFTTEQIEVFRNTIQWYSLEVKYQTLAQDKYSHEKPDHKEIADNRTTNGLLPQDLRKTGEIKSSQIEVTLPESDKTVLKKLLLEIWNQEAQRKKKDAQSIEEKTRIEQKFVEYGIREFERLQNMVAIASQKKELSHHDVADIEKKWANSLPPFPDLEEDDPAKSQMIQQMRILSKG